MANITWTEMTMTLAITKLKWTLLREGNTVVLLYSRTGEVMYHCTPQMYFSSNTTEWNCFRWKYWNKSLKKKGTEIIFKFCNLVSDSIMVAYEIDPSIWNRPYLQTHSHILVTLGDVCLKVKSDVNLIIKQVHYFIESKTLFRFSSVFCWYFTNCIDIVYKIVPALFKALTFKSDVNGVIELCIEWLHNDWHWNDKWWQV